MANEFKVRKGLIVQGSGSNIFDVQGSQGQLFSVTDSLSGSLFSVNDISGIPIMEVFSDNTIKMGTFNQEAIIISGSRTGMGTALPQAELHISGANNDSLFRIQSPASASIIFVTGSGLVGIGTLTPTQKLSVDNGNVGFTSGFGISWDSDTEWIKRAAASDQLQIATQNTVRLNIGSTQGQLVAIGLGTTAASAQFQVRGGGATSGTTAMRIEDSGGNARLTILDDGTSAFNISHLYVSSSGRIGIGTSTPTMGVLDINGITRIRSSNQLYFGGTGAGDWQGAISGQASGLLVNANLLTINNSGYASPATQSFVINTSQNVAIGPHSPTVRLHVSGASNAGLFEIDSPAVNNIIYVSGSGNVGIGTGTPTNTLQVVGGITATSITASIISASSGITGSLFGTASVAVTAQTASFLPIGTYSITSSWAQSASNAVNAQTASFITSTATNAFIQGGNSFGATALLGTNDTNNLELETGGTTRVFISSSGRVGIGTSSPTERLHVDGNLLVTGRLTAEEFHTEFVSASIIYQSGSTQFGNSSDDTHIFTGSLRVNGSITGSLFGTASVSVNAQTASFLPIGTYSITSSWAQSASNAVNAQTASFLSGAFLQGGNSFGATALLGTNDTQDLQLETSGSVRMTISSSGNVGIGTTTPKATLDVAGTVVQGQTTTATGNYSHAEGVDTLTTGEASHAEGTETVASGNYSHAEGASSISSGATSHAEGSSTLSSGFSSHAEGISTIASGAYSHAEGLSTIAYGLASHAEGLGTITQGDYQLTIGQYNISLPDQSAFIIGNGIDDSNRSNLLFASGSEIQITGSLSVSGSITGSLFGTASNALTASFITPTGTNAFVQGGNSFGTTALLGTNDNQNLQLETSGSVRVHIGNNGNVGIGTTSPTERLHVSGNIYTEDNLIIPSGKDIMIRDTVDDTTGTIIRGTYDRSGTDPSFDVVSTSSIFLAGLTNTRIDLFGTNTTYIGGLPNFGRMLFTIPNSGNALFSSPSNANILFVSGSGNVGIGTGTPTRTLYVSSSVWDNTSGAGVVIENSNTVGSGLTLKPSNSVVTNGSNGWAIYAGGPDAIISDGNLGFWAHGTNAARLVIQRAGNVGIGETSPSAKLEIRGSGATSATTAFRVENSNASASLTILDDGTSAFNTNHLYVSSSGNVGIGTATPVHNLVVNGSTGVSINANGAIFPNIHRDSADGGMLLRSWNGSTFTNNVKITPTNEVGIGTTSPTAELHVSGANADSLFRVSSPSATSALFVSGSGLVGIGTTTPGERLHVAGNIRLDGTRYIDWGSGNSRITDLGVTAGQGYPITISTFGPIGTGTSNTLTEKLRLTGSGSLGLGTTSPSARFHISGGFTDGNLMRVQSPTGAEYFFISASGNVGIGTTTPTSLLQVAGRVTSTELYVTNGDAIYTTNGSVGIGTSGPTSTNRLQVRGSGATSTTTALRVENSAATARLTILDDGTSAFNTNHLYVSSSGRVGVGTATPNATLDVNGNTIITGSITNTSTITTLGTIAAPTQTISGVNGWAPSSGTTNLLNIAGNLIPTSTGIINSLAITSTVSQSVNPTTIIRGILVSPTFNTLGPQYRAIEWNNNQGFGLYGVGSAPNYLSGSLGIGTTSPSASLHISGANADNLFRISSPSTPNALFVSGSGNVGIGTTTPTQRLDVRGNTIIAGTTPVNPVGGTLEVYNNGSNAQITIHEDSGSAEARLAFRTEGSDTIFRNLNTRFSIDAETKPDALTLSLYGRVGIGTSTSVPSSLLQVRGEGATSATTAFRVENSNQDPELTVLDNGNVGISTATPSDLLTINSPSSTGSLRLTHLSEIETLRATSFHSGLYIGNNLYYNGSGDPATNSLYALDSGSNNRGGNLLLMRANNGTTSLGGFYFYTALSSSIANTTATLTENLRILPSASVFSNTRVGIGATPNTSYAFDIQSSAPNAGAARINGNNTVWLFNDVAQVSRGTTSINRMVQMNMGPVNASSGVQSLLVLSQSINQSSTAGYTTLVVNANETGTGSGNKLLQAWQFNGTDRTVINNSGSLGIGIATPSASLHISGANNANLLRVSSPSASSALFISGSGNVGVGTATPAGLIDIFQGGNSRILVTTDNGFVGLQQSSPTEQIHITSDPVNGKYLQIDAGQTSNAPRQVVDSPATAIIGYAAGDSTVYLSEPRWWMEIKLDGNIVLIPCYQPDV